MKIHQVTQKVTSKRKPVVVSVSSYFTYIFSSQRVVESDSPLFIMVRGGTEVNQSYFIIVHMD